MAGTRLVVHTIFVIELLLLVGASFFYASNKNHDPSASAEPFLPDQSGWKIVVEDVSPSNEEDGDGGIVGIISYARESASMILSQIQSLLGTPSSSAEATAPQHESSRRRPSALFVQEMRRRVGVAAAVAANHGAEGGTAVTQNRISHPLKFSLRIPQAKLSHQTEFLVGALEKGLRQQRADDMPLVAVVQTSSRFSDVEIEACDDIHMPTIQSRHRLNHREVNYPEIILFIGCTTSATILDRQQQKMSSVEVIGNSDLIIVRSKRTFDQSNELLNDLESEISHQILSTVFISRSSLVEYRLGKVYVNLIDENPSSHHHVAVQSSITVKTRVDILGKALSSSVRSIVGPLLDDLSFIYGGQIEQINDERVIHGMGKIGLEAHSSAYLPLPNDIVQSRAEKDEHESSTASKYVSSEGFASSMHNTHSHQAVTSANCLVCQNDVVEWNLFVPSWEHSPLMVRDEKNGEVGESIILSLTGQSFNGGITTNDVYPNGISIVNVLFDPSTGIVNDDRLYKMYQDTISNTLVHLVGFLRASYGLPVFTTPKHRVANGKEGVQTLSFWELESIAQSHYNSSLEYALQQTDSLFAVLHQHGRTLALPTEVAHKLNNATYLLRQSISLVEEGYPIMYATSLIHGSLHYLESVQRDHRVHELPYFALDHYLAVFSPLVLPLLLPMLAGFIREVKRYRELQKKKIIERL